MIREKFEAVLERIQNDTRLQYLILLAITGLAGAIRFYKLGAWSFWIDEIFTINRATIHYKDFATTIQTILDSVWIPLSVILTSGALKLFGVSEWSARLVPAVIGTLSVPILYFPVKKHFGAGTGLIAVLLLAVSPWHITWSQNARFYTLLFLLYILGLCVLYVGLERDRARYFFLFLILFFFALSERMIAVFLGVVAAVYLILLTFLPFDKPPGLRIQNIFILMLPVAAGGLAELNSFLFHGESRFFGDFDWFLMTPIDDPLRLLSYISFDIGIPLMILSFFCGLYLLAQKHRFGLLVFIGAVLPVVLLLLLNPFVFTKDRYVFPTLACWIFLGSVAIKEIGSQLRGAGKILTIGLLFLLLADAGGHNLLYFYANNGNHLDWKGAFMLVDKKTSDQDLIVSWWPEFGPYYLEGKEIIPWASINAETVMNSSNRTWFILDSETVWLNSKMKQWVEENAELIDVRYLRTPEINYLVVYVYPSEEGPLESVRVFEGR